MSDTTRKRCRKSKLVPRECALENEEEIDILQVKLKRLKTPVILNNTQNVHIPKRKINILDRINKSIDTSLKQKSQDATKTSNSNEPMEFSVKVEVESCEEMEEDWRTDISYLLTYKEILHATDELLHDSTDIADEIVAINIRNTIGDFVKHKFKLDYHDKLIQNLLNATKKDDLVHGILCYKCYICWKAWWHLSEFRNHIKSHKSIQLSFEIENKDVNIIGHYRRSVKLNNVWDFDIEGFCNKCGMDYEWHKSNNRMENSLYSRQGCPLYFETCTELFNHIPSCKYCNEVFDVNKKCRVCRMNFEFDTELKEHLIICHTVRSDVPAIIDYKTCDKCSTNYIDRCLHCVSGGTKKKYECPYCHRKFSLQGNLLLHTRISMMQYVCDRCSVVVKCACVTHEHMLKHSDKYVTVKKCVLCTDFKLFLNDDAVGRHKRTHHKHSKTENIYIDITIPKACINLYGKMYGPEIRSHFIDSDQNTSDNDSNTTCEENRLKDKALKTYGKAKNVDPMTEACDTQNKKHGLKLKNINDLLSKTVSDTVTVPPDQNTDIEQIENQASSNEMEGVVVKVERDDWSVECDDKQRKENDSSLFENVCTDLISTLECSITNVKSEPEDSVVIKEEPEEFITEDQSEEVVEEVNSQEEDFEDDIIQLNIDFADPLVTLTEDSDTEYLKEVSEKEEKARSRKQRMYTCRKCGFQAKHRQYKEHLDDCQDVEESESEEDEGNKALNKSGHRDNSKKLVCLKCNKEFITLRKYLTHLVVHGHKSMVCPICKTEYSDYAKLIGHVNMHIKNMFIKYKSISGDVEIVPWNSVREYQCKECNDLVQFEDFFGHWQQHIPDPLDGSSADTPESSKFMPVIKLNSRLKPQAICEAIVEESIKLLKSSSIRVCNQCGRSFGRYNECKRHIIEHLLLDAYAKDMKELRCQICDAKFHKAEKYKCHMRKHAGLPVYMCELCDKTFSDSSNFTKHKKVHNLSVSGCGLCGKKFQLKATLDKHMEQHRNSEPVTCTPCNRTFHFESEYKRHLRHKHTTTDVRSRCIPCRLNFKTVKEKWDHLWDVHKLRKIKADCPLCSESFRKFTDVKKHAYYIHNVKLSMFKLNQTNNEETDLVTLVQDSGKSDGPETLLVFE